jgi:CheY-like chemotaxis protein
VKSAVYRDGKTRFHPLTVVWFTGHSLSMAHVLVVEDHADSCEAMSLLLRRAGHEVIAAASGRQAMAMVIDRTPDVLLLDLALPEMNGVELIEVIRSYYRLSTIPVVVLTALSQGKLFEDAQSLTLSSMLLKGNASADQIREAVEKAASQADPGARNHSPERWRVDSISPL